MAEPNRKVAKLEVSPLLTSKDLLRCILLSLDSDADIASLASTCKTLNGMIYGGQVLSHRELLGNFLLTLSPYMADRLALDETSLRSVLIGLQNAGNPRAVRLLLGDFEIITFLGVGCRRLASPLPLANTPEDGQLLYSWRSTFMVTYPGEKCEIQVDGMQASSEWWRVGREMIMDTYNPLHIRYLLKGTVRVLQGTGPDCNGVTTFVHRLKDESLCLLPFVRWMQVHPLSRTLGGTIAGIGFKEQWMSFTIRASTGRLETRELRGTCTVTKRYLVVDSVMLPTPKPQVVTLMICSNCGRQHHVCHMVINPLTHDAESHMDVYCRNVEIASMRPSDDNDLIITTVARDQHSEDEVAEPPPDFYSGSCLSRTRADLRAPYDFAVPVQGDPGHPCLLRVYVMGLWRDRLSFLDPNWIYERPVDHTCPIPRWRDTLAPPTKARWLACYLKNLCVGKKGYMCVAHGSRQEDGTCRLNRLKIMCCLPKTTFGRIVTVQPDVNGDIISLGGCIRSPMPVMTANYVYAVPLSISMGMD